MAKIESYPEVLNKQRSYKPPRPLQGKDKYEKAGEITLEAAKEELSLLLELLKHYDINPNMGEKTWFNLSLALAKDHVPAFQKKEKPGPKEKWTLKEKLQLIALFEFEKARGESTPQAAKNISNAGYFKRTSQKADKKVKRAGKTLRNTYDEAKNDKFITTICSIAKKHTNSNVEYIDSLFSIAADL